MTLSTIMIGTECHTALKIPEANSKESKMVFNASNFTTKKL